MATPQDIQAAFNTLYEKAEDQEVALPPVSEWRNVKPYKFSSKRGGFHIYTQGMFGRVTEYFVHVDIDTYKVVKAAVEAMARRQGA